MIDDRTWIRGVSQPLPAGESLLWQGAPEWRALARHVLHIRVVAFYFAIIILAGLYGAVSQALPFHQLVVTLLTQIGLGAIVVGGVALYAWLTARGTVYAITDRRVVLKVGLVLPITVNIPFRLIESAGSRTFSDGTGQIALTLRRPDRMGFLTLWPHVRPWKLRYPEPALRALLNPAAVATLLRQAAMETGPVALEEPTLPEPPHSAPSASIALRGHHLGSEAKAAT